MFHHASRTNCTVMQNIFSGRLERERNHSASHFSHFLAYLSRSCDRSRITNVKTTLAKNSEARFNFCSADVRISTGNAAYAGAAGWDRMAFVCSSSNCAWRKSFSRPRTYAAGESRLMEDRQLVDHSTVLISRELTSFRL